MTPDEILDATTYIVAVDYPGKDVPETLARGGFGVITKEGPGPLDYMVWTLDGDVVSSRKLDHAPTTADLVYSFRPLDELEGIAEWAQRLGAKAMWIQPDADHDSARARTIVAKYGLAYVDDPDIREAVQARAEQG